MIDVTAGDVALVAASFALSEAFSYVMHRWVMHGRVGMALHRSHHRPRTTAVEANDAYPVLFAGLAVAAFAIGTSWPSLRPLVAWAVGYTLYGIAYLIVHDLYIHRRLPVPMPRLRYLEWCKSSHRIHHLFGGEPYGMLLPVVPARLRARAAASARDPFPATPARTA